MNGWTRSMRSVAIIAMAPAAAVMVRPLLTCQCKRRTSGKPCSEKAITKLGNSSLRGAGSCRLLNQPCGRPRLTTCCKWYASSAAKAAIWPGGKNTIRWWSHTAIFHGKQSWVMTSHQRTKDDKSSLSEVRVNGRGKPPTAKLSLLFQAVGSQWPLPKIGLTRC